MHQIDIRHLLAAVLAIAAMMVAGLWSWNTLADLFGAPEAGFRHAVAALVLLATLRFAIRRYHAPVRRHPRPLSRVAADRAHCAFHR